MRSVYSNDYPKTLASLKDHCEEIGITSEPEYRRECIKHDLPYMPNITYREEWDDLGGWKYLFPSAPEKVKKKIILPKDNPDVISKAVHNETQSLPILPKPVIEKDKNGKFTFLSLIVTLRKYKVFNMESYQKHYASNLTDFPRNPKEYYKDLWVDEDFFFLWPLSLVEEKRKEKMTIENPL